MTFAPPRVGWSGRAPASARPPVCRCSGCAAPAGDDGLCERHHARQLAVRVAVEVRADGARGVPVPTWLVEVAAAREAPWRALAACRGMTTTMFPDAERGRPADYTAALAICGECPVVEPCQAAGARENEGVWGATTPADRRRARRRQVA